MSTAPQPSTQTQVIIHGKNHGRTKKIGEGMGASVHVFYKYSLPDAAPSSSAAPDTVIIEATFKGYHQFRDEAVRRYPWLWPPPMEEPLIPMPGIGSAEFRKERELRTQAMLFAVANGLSVPTSTFTQPTWPAGVSYSPKVHVVQTLGQRPSASSSSSSGGGTHHHEDQMNSTATSPTAAAAQQLQLLQYSWIPSVQERLQESFDTVAFDAAAKKWERQHDFCSSLFVEIERLTEGYFEEMRKNAEQTAQCLRILGAATAATKTLVVENPAPSFATAAAAPAQLAPPPPRPGASASATASSPSASSSSSSLTAPPTTTANNIDNDNNNGDDITSRSNNNNSTKISTLSALYTHRATRAFPDAIDQATSLLLFIEGAKDLCARRRDLWRQLERKVDAVQKGPTPFAPDEFRAIARATHPALEALHDASWAAFRQLQNVLLQDLVRNVTSAAVSGPSLVSDQQQQQLQQQQRQPPLPNDVSDDDTLLGSFDDADA